MEEFGRDVHISEAAAKKAARGKFRAASFDRFDRNAELNALRAGGCCRRCAGRLRKRTAGFLFGALINFD
jgi:hypothetical protein